MFPNDCLSSQKSQWLTRFQISTIQTAIHKKISIWTTSSHHNTYKCKYAFKKKTKIFYVAFSHLKLKSLPRFSFRHRKTLVRLSIVHVEILFSLSICSTERMQICTLSQCVYGNMCVCLCTFMAHQTHWITIMCVLRNCLHFVVYV